MEKQFHSPNTGQPDSSGHQIDLEQLLKDGNIIRIHPQGYSMYPLFLPGRDEALIESVCADACKKNDVVLYRRDSGILVLHRICRITDDGFYLVGDNQREVEGPLRPSQIIGRLVAFVRDGKEISAEQPFYRFLSSLWLFLLPVRPFCFRLSAFLILTMRLGSSVAAEGILGRNGLPLGSFNDQGLSFMGMEPVGDFFREVLVQAVAAFFSVVGLSAAGA